MRTREYKHECKTSPKSDASLFDIDFSRYDSAGHSACTDASQSEDARTMPTFQIQRSQLLRSFQGYMCRKSEGLDAHPSDPQGTVYTSPTSFCLVPLNVRFHSGINLVPPLLRSRSLGFRDGLHFDLGQRRPGATEICFFPRGWVLSVVV